MILPSEEEKKKTQTFKSADSLCSDFEFLAYNNMKLRERMVLNFINIKFLTATMLFTKGGRNDSPSCLQHCPQEIYSTKPLDVHS